MRNLVLVKARLARGGMLAIGQSASEPEPHRVRSKCLAIGADDLDARGRSPMRHQRTRPSLGGGARGALPRLHLSAAMSLKSSSPLPQLRCQLSVGARCAGCCRGPGRAGARGCRGRLGEGVAAGRAQHVDVNGKAILARAPILMSWFTAAALGGEHKRRVREQLARALTSSPRSG
jgi:hypothetical protein